MKQLTGYRVVALLAAVLLVSTSGVSGQSVDSASAQMARGEPGQWSNVTPANTNLVDELSCGNFGATSVLADPLRQSDLYAEFNCQGLWKSTDYGLTWHGPINTGSGSSSVTGSAADLAIAPGTPGMPVIYSADVRQGGPGLWKSVDGAVNWSRLNVGPAGARQDMGWIVVDPSDPDHLVAVPHELSALYQSTDAGATWTSVTMAAGMNANGTGALTFVSMGNANTTRNTWLWLAQATSACGSGTGGTWRTTNGGGAWTRVDCNEKSHGGEQWYQPDSSGVIYMPGIYSANGWGVLRSTDYGQTWTHVGSTGQAAIVIGTPNHVYSLYGWACGIGCDVDPKLQLAPQPGITGWSSPARPAGMQQGPDDAAVVFDGSQYVIVTANYASGLWRYVEPVSNAPPAAPTPPLASPSPDAAPPAAPENAPPVDTTPDADGAAPAPSAHGR